jgi:hypothetical protein
MIFLLKCWLWKLRREFNVAEFLSVIIPISHKALMSFSLDFSQGPILR